MQGNQFLLHYLMDVHVVKSNFSQITHCN